MSQTKERPILFSRPMVRAILEGRKTVTRRIVKGGQIPKFNGDEPEHDFRWSAVGQHHPRYGYIVHGETEQLCAVELGEKGVCPHGRPGDRLWVRETWSKDFGGHYPYDRIWFQADDDRKHDIEVRSGQRGIFSPEQNEFVPFKWRPSIHMFRRDSRILLEITSVRVERLQDISYDQALAEGVRAAPEGLFDIEDSLHLSLDPRETFASLWESINGDGAWNANPWVWVVEFKRVTP